MKQEQVEELNSFFNKYRDDFFLLGNKKMKCKRYTICCENDTQANQVLEVLNAQYQTQFQLEQKR